MLTSITPLGERGRHSRWGVTVTAFAFGATVASAALGALAGLIGRLVLPGSTGIHLRLAVLAVAVAVAAALDLTREPAPGPRRQVNERWLDRYRGWVYGLGFGAQLGIGLTTVISSAATYATFVAAFLSREPAAGALILGCFGLVRGITPLAAARVTDPQSLVAFHRRFDAARVRARRAGTPVLVVLLTAAALGAAL
jgi:Cytochrome C biogenesis protein transmembrane region